MKSRPRQVGAVRASDTRYRIQSVESVQMFQDLSAIEHFHGEGDDRCENEVFEFLLYDFLILDSTSQIERQCH